MVAEMGEAITLPNMLERGSKSLLTRNSDDIYMMKHEKHETEGETNESDEVNVCVCMRKWRRKVAEGWEKQPAIWLQKWRKWEMIMNYLFSNFSLSLKAKYVVKSRQ